MRWTSFSPSPETTFVSVSALKFSPLFFALRVKFEETKGAGGTVRLFGVLLSTRHNANSGMDPTSIPFPTPSPPCHSFVIHSPSDPSLSLPSLSLVLLHEDALPFHSHNQSSILPPSFIPFHPFQIQSSRPFVLSPFIPPIFPFFVRLVGLLCKIAIEGGNVKRMAPKQRQQIATIKLLHREIGIVFFGHKLPLTPTPPHPTPIPRPFSSPSFRPPSPLPSPTSTQFSPAVARQE